MYLEFGPAAGAAELVHHLLVLVVIAGLRQALPAKAARPDGSWGEGKGTWRIRVGYRRLPQERAGVCTAGLVLSSPEAQRPGTHRLGQKTPLPPQYLSVRPA